MPSNASDHVNTTTNTNMEAYFYLRQILPIAIFILGLFGNTIVFLIFSHRRYAAISTIYYMKILAVYDQLVMVMLLVRVLLKLPQSPIVQNDLFCKFYFGFAFLFLRSTGWLLLCTSIDRLADFNSKY